MNRKTQVLIATGIWFLSVVGIVAATHMKRGLSRLSSGNMGEVAAAEPGPGESREPPVAPPQGGETAVTPPVPLPEPAVAPEPPRVGPPIPDSASSPVPPPPANATVTRSAPSADLLPPVVPVTAEPPLVETAAAKPPAREDNVWRGEPLPAAAPRPLAESSLVLCRWSNVGGKTRTRPRQGVGKQAEGPFVGTFACTLDEQQGLLLPQKASEQMGLPRYVYVTPGPEDCLWVCSAAALERLTDKLSTDAGRLYYAQTARVLVDRGGRIVLPESFGPLDCFCRDVVLLGTGDHFELWDAQRWQHYLDQKAARK